MDEFKDIYKNSKQSNNFELRLNGSTCRKIRSAYNFYCVAHSKMGNTIEIQEMGKMNALEDLNQKYEINQPNLKRWQVASELTKNMEDYKEENIDVHVNGNEKWDMFTELTFRMPKKTKKQKLLLYGKYNKLKSVSALRVARQKNKNFDYDYDQCLDYFSEDDEIQDELIDESNKNKNQINLNIETLIDHHLCSKNLIYKQKLNKKIFEKKFKKRVSKNPKKLYRLIYCLKCKIKLNLTMN
ncbi:hypothetical protein BpHYR1_042235 [Brachionus plicatilis]|uniref:Uncharacterized protein n=1 Tax=Brachionus plicatilis TaxID=10195 RepID=A0A3M7PE28_BRAPC|nr:hypothetical protein BpHYR1_042235 [Brachionus plicatilis]